MPQGFKAISPENTIFVEDNTGSRFVVDLDTMRRYRVPSEGSPGTRRAVRRIWGQPVTKVNELPPKLRANQRQAGPPFDGNEIYLDTRLGFVPSESVFRAFGGANQLERYVAGQVDDPFNSERNPFPHYMRTDEGLVFRPSALNPDVGDVESAEALMASFLEPYGLNSTRMKRLLEGLIVTGASSDEIWAEIKATDAWKERFAGNEMRREAGLPELSAAQYVQMEQQMRTMMKTAGVPEGFYDNPDDFAGWIGQGVSPQILAERINAGVRQVLQAPDAVREEFDVLTGGNGDQALLAAALDPERATEWVEENYMRAEAKGRFEDSGFSLSDELTQDIADEAQSLGMSADQLRAQVAESVNFTEQSSALLAETVSEGDDDLSAEDTAAASLLGDAGASRALDRRLRERLAEQAGAGGAALTEGGTTFGDA